MLLSCGLYDCSNLVLTCIVSYNAGCWLASADHPGAAQGDSHRG